MSTTLLDALQNPEPWEDILAAEVRQLPIACAVARDCLNAIIRAEVLAETMEPHRCDQLRLLVAQQCSTFYFG